MKQQKLTDRKKDLYFIFSKQQTNMEANTKKRSEHESVGS